MQNNLNEETTFHWHGLMIDGLADDGSHDQLLTGDRAILAVHFDESGIFMFHCHILEHENNGMMGQVLVE